jgi:hypothetical protein
MFKLWSETNNEAKKLLSPNLGLRDLDQLNQDEKQKIWYFLDCWFSGEDNKTKIFLSILELNELHKYRAYAKNFLEDSSYENAFLDFQDIFFNQDQHTVFELLSCFCQQILNERKDKSGGIYQHEKESDEKYEKRITEWRHEEFDRFAKRVNDVFEHFSINVVLTRGGFIMRQDKKITEKIYFPVLNFLSSQKWIEVNKDLGDAFKAYQEKTENGYSNCITHSISALQAFLQVLIHNKIGKGDISTLIKEAKKKNLIPNDSFSSQIFTNIESILMQERQKTSDAHPKKEYANEKGAQLVLNLIMIFLQHCIQK